MIDNSRYLCFKLGKDEFAIPLLSIKEVLGMPEVTPVPQAPPHFLGLINLRGQVISLMDLRIKLGIKPNKSEETSVIILDLGDYNLGVVVDQVNSVQLLTAQEVQDKPVIENTKNFEHINGVFRKNDKLILLLDIAKALSVSDKSVLTKQIQKAA